MKALEQILRIHADRYPEMTPTDAVKLIYQNEFGGGHMIKDTCACMAYLRKEYAGVTKTPGAPPTEDIGNGIVRVHLAPLEEDKLEALGRAFIASAAAHTGELSRFQQKLEVLCKLTGEGIFSFDTPALEAYLTGYAAAGYPPVSHSPAYREAYRPAYRIVLTRYLPDFLGKSHSGSLPEARKSF